MSKKQNGRGVRKSPYKKQVNVRLSPRMYDLLSRALNGSEITQSQLVRKAIVAYLTPRRVKQLKEIAA